MERSLVEILGHPLRTWRLFSCKYIHPALLRRKRGLVLEGGIRLSGVPMIDIRRGATITLGHNVLLRSENRGYHVNMHSPVKLLADHAGAEIFIGAETRIYGSCIHAYERISIGKRCLVAANSEIFDGSGHALSFPDVENRIFSRGGSRPVTIEDYVWIGANSIILPGVTIGRGSVIGAGSVVHKDLPPMVVAAGNPATIVKDCSNQQS